MSKDILVSIFKNPSKLAKIDHSIIQKTIIKLVKEVNDDPNVLISIFKNPLAKIQKKGTTDPYLKLFFSFIAVYAGHKFIYNKETLMHIASHYGIKSIVNTLLSMNFNMNEANKDGLTPLHIAAQNGDTNIVKALLAADADVNIPRTTDGSTSLHIAADLNSNIDIIFALLESGADMNKTRNNNETPLAIATAKNIDGLNLFNQADRSLENLGNNVLNLEHLIIRQLRTKQLNKSNIENILNNQERTEINNILSQKLNNKEKLKLYSFLRTEGNIGVLFLAIDSNFFNLRELSQLQLLNKKYKDTANFENQFENLDPQNLFKKIITVFE